MGSKKNSSRTKKRKFLGNRFVRRVETRSGYEFAKVNVRLNENPQKEVNTMGENLDEERIDSKLKDNPQKESKIMEEREKTGEADKADLKARVDQLESHVNQFLNMRAEINTSNSKISELQLKISQKLKLIKKFKNREAKYQKNLMNKDNSLKKMTEHIQRIWNVVIAYRNKLDNIGQLTVKEKNELVHEYKEFLSLGVPSIKSYSGDVFKILNDNLLNSPDLFSSSGSYTQNSCSNINGDTCKDQSTVPSDAASSVLQSSRGVTASNSKDSLNKIDQSLQDNMSQTPRFHEVQSFFPCSPDAVNHEESSYVYTKETSSDVSSLLNQKSFTEMPPEEHSSISLFSGTSHEIENMYPQIERFPEQRSCSASATKPFLELMEAFSGIAPHSEEVVNCFSVEMRQSNAEQNSPQMIESYKNLKDSEDASTEYFAKELSFSSSSMGSPDLNHGEDLNKNLFVKMKENESQLDMYQNIKSFKREVPDCASPELVKEDLIFSNDSIEASDVLSRVTQQDSFERTPFYETRISDSLFKQQDMYLKTIDKDNTVVSGNLETTLIERGDINKNVHIPEKFNTFSSENELGLSTKLSPKESLENSKIIGEINCSYKRHDLNFSDETKITSPTKQFCVVNYNKNAKKDKNGEHQLESLFQDYRKTAFSRVNVRYHVENLIKIATNPAYAIDVSVLLFHIFNYLHKSKKNPLLSFLYYEDPSVLLPFDENCIVTALLSIELQKKPLLKGLLSTAVTMTHHLILAKKGFTVLGLASLCRVLTEICKRQRNSEIPVKLCGDLLKVKHKFAPYLIASISGIWKELFQIGNNLQAEEVCFHSSILYGASKRPEICADNYWDGSNNIIEKNFAAPPIKNARSRICNLKKIIQLKCINSSWNSLYLISSLVILAAYEDWDYIQEHLLTDFIIPNLTKFGCETLNENAFDLFCNLYVDVLLLNPQAPLDTVFTNFFKNSSAVNGKNFVQDSTALAIMRFVYSKNRKLPAILSNWCHSNHQDSIRQQIELLMRRRVMSEDLRFLRLEDVQVNEEVVEDHQINKDTSKADEPTEKSENLTGAMIEQSSFNSEESSKLDTRSKLQQSKEKESLSEKAAKESATDELKRKPPKRSKRLVLKKMKRLFTQTPDQSEEKSYCKVKTRKKKGEESLHEERAKLFITSKYEKGSSIKAKNVKSEEDEGLFEQKSTTDKYKDFLTSVSKQKKSGKGSLFKQKRKLSTTDNSEDVLSAKNKKRKVDKDEILSKQKTEKFSTKESHEEQSTKTQPVTKKKRSYKLKTKVFTTGALENLSTRFKNGKVKKGLSSRKTLNMQEIKIAKRPYKKRIKKESWYDTFDEINLPEGWTRGKVLRKSGKTKGQFDIYYYNPEGVKFRSKVEIANYLNRTHSTLNISMFPFKKESPIKTPSLPIEPSISVPSTSAPSMPAPSVPPPSMPAPSMPAPSMHEPLMHEPSMHEPSMHEPLMHEPSMHEPSMPEPSMPEPVMPIFSPKS